MTKEMGSYGTRCMMAELQLGWGLRNGTVTVEPREPGVNLVNHLPTGKWFTAPEGWEKEDFPTMMLGAACGDVIGSIYEGSNVKAKQPRENLIKSSLRFTDDTVMTCAVAEGIMKALMKLPDNWMEVPEHREIIMDEVKNAMVFYGRKYPWAGYGGGFKKWLKADVQKPYQSYGNGSAMRASYAGWAARTLEEAKELAELSAAVTHDHPEGIAGADTIAASIFILRQGGSKEDVRKYVAEIYDMDFTLDEIRRDYRGGARCTESVPQAIEAFLEGKDFCDVISSAISIGGDSDTIAAMAGSLAEVIYPIPQDIRGEVLYKLDDYLCESLVETIDFLQGR